MVYIHRILIYRSNYFMKFIQSQVREINAFLSRHLRVYSLFSCVIWLLLIGAFLRTTWNLSYIIWNQSSYGNNANLNNYDKRWKPTIHTVSRLTDAMLNLWPVYIAKGILPPSDITLISFSSQSPFPFDSQLNSVTEFDKREQYRVLLTNIFHGLITRLIWIYPSWKQSSFNQFYKKSQFHVGLARINLLEDDNNNNNSNNDLKSNFPSRITTFCLCNPAGNFCSLPLLSSSKIHIPRQSCSVASSFIYEEIIDVMAESILSQDENERLTKDLIYLFSRESYFQSDKSTLSKTSSSPSHTSLFHNKRTVWIDSLFILHIDMNYFIESITKVNNTSSDLSEWFTDYIRMNSLNDSNVDFSTYEPLVENAYLTSHKNDKHIADNNSNDNHTPVIPASIIHQYTILLKDVYNKLSYLSLTEQNHLINDINQFINSMLHFITTHDPNLLSYWSNQSLISSTSCCYLKPSIELISLNSNENIYVFNQWKNRYRIAFYYLDNYCSYSDAMINVLLNKPTMEEFQRTQYLYESLVRAQEEAKLTKIQKHPCYSELKRNRDSLSQKAVIQSELLVPYLSIASEIMVGAKKELSSLWSWLCTLNTITLKFISQFVVCTYQSENHMQSIGLCNREKSSLISFDEIPVIQRSSLTLYTLESVITCLPRPLSVNLVMHPSWEQLIHKMHLSTELCKILNESVLNKQDNLSRKKDKG